MIHIPTRTVLAWYYYSWEAPLWKPLNVPRTSPCCLTLTKQALAEVGQLKITCQGATLAGMTCVVLKSRDGRLLEVRGKTIMQPEGHGRAEERQNGQRREGNTVRKAAGTTTRKIPSMKEKMERSHLLCPALSPIWKYKHALCNLAGVIISLNYCSRGFQPGISSYI